MTIPHGRDLPGAFVAKEGGTRPLLKPIKGPLFPVNSSRPLSRGNAGGSPSSRSSRRSANHSLPLPR